jgi:hypothetical protein
MITLKQHKQFSYHSKLSLQRNYNVVDTMLDPDNISNIVTTLSTQHSLVGFMVVDNNIIITLIQRNKLLQTFMVITITYCNVVTTL